MGGGALSGVIVLDLSRMLPGAVLDRVLLELGARVLKVESPAGGDPMRALPPVQPPGEGEGGGGGIGVAFAAFLGGAESLALDLARPAAAAAVRRLAARADVLVESFRPGTLARWGLDPAQLAAENPRLVVCSLSSFGAQPPGRDQVGHDLNFAAQSGLLALLAAGATPHVPGAQLVDVTAGILAGCSILAALLERERTGRGRVLEQPLATGAVPFLAWAWAEARGEPTQTRASSWLSGGAPAYRLYDCAGGEPVALGAIEPKLWLAFLQLVDLPELAAAALDAGAAGRAAAARIQERLALRPRADWLAGAAALGVPLSPVNDPAAGLRAPYYAARGGAGAPWLGLTSSEAGAQPRPPARAPTLGEHTDAVLREAGLSPEEIAAARGG